MHNVAIPPYGEHLDTGWQTFATVALWGASLALLAWGVKIARDERSPFPVILWFAVAIGSIIEPLYDTAYHLYWLDDGKQWTFITAFDIPQPVWVMPAYIMVFGCPAMLLYRKLARGATMSTVFKFAGLFATTTAIFEITAVNIPLYKYYGHAPMRVAGYPLWICFMEAAQITGFAVLAAVLKLRATKTRHLLALLVVFPANFAFECLGAGFPTIMAINTPGPQDLVMWITGVISIGFAATGLWWTTQLLLTLQKKPVAAEEPSAGRAARVETSVRPLEPTAAA